MADAPKILGTDTLRNAYPKLNQAIDLVNNFQTQLDTIVVDGDSSVEAAQARVKADGSAFTTLKERLDNSDSQLVERALQNDLDTTNQNVAAKADKNYVDTQIQSVASGSPKGIFATLADLQTAFPTGSTNIYVVVADGKWYYWNGLGSWAAGGIYQATGILLRSISFEKTAFIKIGSTNLFNKSTITIDKYVSPDNGNLGTLSGFFVSDFIPVDPSTQYIINVARHYAIYDQNKTYISGATPASPYTNVAFTTPANAAYIRFSSNYSVSAVDSARVNKGNTVLPYDEYYLSADEIKPKLKSKQVKNEHIDDNTIAKEKLSFIVPEAVPGKNKFNVATITAGKYVNWLSGSIDTNASYDASDYIAVKASTTYTRKVNSHIAFYDANKVYISGLQVSGLTFTTPANAAYIRVSVPTGTGATEQIEEGSVSTTLESFGYRLPGLLSNPNSETEVKINLPKKIYGLVGQELNIYFDNIVNVKDINYDFDVVSSVGDQYEQFYRFTPDTAGSFPITITVLKNNVELASVSSTIIISAAGAGTGVSKKAIIIGDSTTDNGYPSIKLNENFNTDPMDITLLGTRGSAPNLHEGRSGWKAQHYVENASVSGVTNAFWNPATSAFDFSYYMTQQGYVGVDYVVINLGINDAFNYLDDTSLNVEIPNIINRYNTMINSIKAHNANIKIGIALTIPPNYSQDSFSRTQHSGQTRARYKRNNFLFVKKLIETYQDREAENIFIVPIHLNLDTRYGFGVETIQVNARDTRTMEIAVSNGYVHPGVTGYWQIADSYWFWLKSFEV